MDITYDEEAELMRSTRIVRAGMIAFVLCLAFVVAAQSSSHTNVFDWIAHYGSKASWYLVGGGLVLVLGIGILAWRR